MIDPTRSAVMVIAEPGISLPISGDRNRVPVQVIKGLDQGAQSEEWEDEKQAFPEGIRQKRHIYLYLYIQHTCKLYYLRIFGG